MISSLTWHTQCPGWNFFALVIHPTNPLPVSQPRDSVPSPIIFRVSLVFQAAVLNPSEIPQAASGGEPAVPREGCALTCLRARDMHVREESTLMVAQTLLCIFPRLDNIVYADRRWKEVVDAISVSKAPADRSSKKHPFDTLRRNVDDTRFRSDT